MFRRKRCWNGQGATCCTHGSPAPENEDFLNLKAISVEFAACRFSAARQENTRTVHGHQVPRARARPVVTMVLIIESNDIWNIIEATFPQPILIQADKTEEDA
jgi:hypothetical protein